MFMRRGAGAVRVGVDLVGHALVVGVGVAGGHQALLDAERLVEHLGHRGQAVGRATGVGDDSCSGLSLSSLTPSTKVRSGLSLAGR